MDKMFDKWGGGEVLKKAVRGMLPKNRLRDKRLARLKVFEGIVHPYGQNILRFDGKRTEGRPTTIGLAVQKLIEAPKSDLQQATKS